MNGGSLVVRALAEAGVEVVFGLPGVHNLAIWRALARYVSASRSRRAAPQPSSRPMISATLGATTAPRSASSGLRSV